MEKRVRSPNYPAFGLPEAIKKIEALYKAQHTHGAPRDVVATGLGYNGLNGASATSISALGKFGLLERHGEDYRVSERAMRILHPHSASEKAEAIREAAFLPPLFQELADKFPGRLPGEEVLRNYLIRNGFAPGAVASVILAYRETMELVAEEGGAYDSQPITHSLEPTMSIAAASPPLVAPPAAQPSVVLSALALKGNERSLGRLDFDGGGFVQIIVGGDVETLDALEAVDNLASWARLQASKRSGRTVTAIAETTVTKTSEDEHSE
jgi:hypothetical protein